MLSSEFLILRGIVEGTIRPRPSANPVASPTVAGMVEKGWVRVDGKRLCITEDGLGALECEEADRKAK
jgi:hypothetical protein